MFTKEFGLIFYIHLLLILGVWSSPFWLNWKIIVVFIVLYYLQLFLFEGCLLTKLQFKKLKENTTFYSYYLEKTGLHFNKRKLKIFLDYILPWIILGVAIFFD